MVQESTFKVQTSDFGIQYLTQITPPQLLSDNSRFIFSIVYFKQHLFLATVSYSDDKSSILLRILRTSDFLAPWEEVYQEVLLEKEAEIAEPELWENQNFEKDISIHLEISQLHHEEILCLSLVCLGKLRVYHSKDGQTYSSSSIPVQDKLEFHSSMIPVSFRERLYLFPNKNQHANQSSKQILLTTSDLDLCQWQELDLPFFDDPENIEISAIKVFNSFLYVAVVNQKIGFQVWKSSLSETNNSLSWQLVLSKGAYYYNLSSQIFSLTILNDILYVLSGTSVSGLYGIRHQYKNQFEILGIYGDDDWDLMVGAPRFSPNGLKIPLSSMGPNFDVLGTLEFRSLETYQQRLYLSTFSEEGFQIWVSGDGEAWICIPELGLDDYYNVLVNHAHSTPWGLLLCLETVCFENKRQTQIFLAH